MTSTKGVFGVSLSATTATILLYLASPAAADYNLGGLLTDGFNFVNTAGYTILAQTESVSDRNGPNIPHSSPNNASLLAQIDSLLESAESNWMAIIDLV